LATYKQIQEYVKQRSGVSVKSCWIADVKDAHGLTRGPAHNRQGAQRKYPCPLKYRRIIADALKHFKMIR